MSLTLTYDPVLSRVRAVAAGLLDGGPATRFGTHLNQQDMGVSDFNAAAASWSGVTGIPLSATRHFAGTTYTITTDVAQKISAGLQICLDLAPPYNPVSATHRTNIVAFMAELRAAGANVQVSLLHEPYFGGLSAAQYVAAVQYYGPAIRQYYPLWAVFSGNDAIEANGYFPGVDWVDGIAADDYATGITDLSNCQTMADKYGLPLGLWEFNSAHDFGLDPSPVTGVTVAQATTYFNQIKDLFTARLAAGKPNGNILFFSGKGQTTGTTNFLGSALTQAGGFEGGIAQWVAGSTSSVAHSTTQAKSGTGSLAITCTSAGTIGAAHCSNAVANGLPVTPGDTVGISAWARPGTTARNFQPGVAWKNAAGAHLSSSFVTSVAETTGAWTFNGGTVVAPASAAFVVFTPQVNGAALGEVHYIDDPQIGVLPTSIDHTAPIQYPWDFRIALLSSIRTALNGTGGTTGGYRLERSTDQIRWTTVRGATAALSSAGQLTVDDYEFADAVTNYYRLTHPSGVVVAVADGTMVGSNQVILNSNPYFETDATGWFNNTGEGSIARSTAQAHQGVASLLLTPDGVAAFAAARSVASSDIFPGQTLHGVGWMRCATARTVRLRIDWRDAGGLYLAEEFVDVSIAANLWTFAEVTGIAPGGTVKANINFVMLGTPPASDLLYIDEAKLLRLGITPTLDRVWLKSLMRPFLNRQVTVVDYSNVERASRSGVFQVVGRSFPVAVTDLHNSRQWTLDVLTDTPADATNLDALLSTGEVQFVHVPADSGVPGGYVALGDTNERRPGRRSARRVFSLPLTEVAAPGPDVVPAVGTWTTVTNTYAAWSDVPAAHSTWGDVLQLVGSAADVVVP